jgi:ADP-ribose pyrophosphatase
MIQKPGLEPWSTLSREKVTDCRIFTVDKVRRRSPDGEKEGDFFLIGSKDWVNVIALTPDDRIILIRQYRHGSDEVTLEIPGGILDEGEAPEDAARRELREETGFDCEELTVIGRVRPNPALFDNWAYTVLARCSAPAGEASFDEHEEIEVELVDAGRIDEMLGSGAITHALVVDAFLWYRLHREKGGKRSAASFPR